jgi:hypothetical protein
MVNREVFRAATFLAADTKPAGKVFQQLVFLFL